MRPIFPYPPSEYIIPRKLKEDHPDLVIRDLDIGRYITTKVLKRIAKAAIMVELSWSATETNV
jgi:hypothetical protein